MPHKSTFNDVDIPNEDLITFLFKNIKDYENNIAVVSGKIDTFFLNREECRN